MVITEDMWKELIERIDNIESMLNNSHCPKCKELEEECDNLKNEIEDLYDEGIL